MNKVVIPEDSSTETPDELLVEFAQQGNRTALIEEIYRRANNHPSGYEVSKSNGVDPENSDIEEVANTVWKEYRDVEEPRGERMTLLEMSYGHVADHVFSSVSDSENPKSVPQD